MWNQLLDLEIQQGDVDITRALFQRAVKTKGLKARGAKTWFKKWNEWEGKNGNPKSQAQVAQIAQDWIRASTVLKSGDGGDE